MCGVNMIMETTAIPSKELIPQISNIAPPAGWEGEQISISSTALPSVIESFETTVNGTLPHAAKRTENLIDAIYGKFGISVSTAYLNVDTEATYHALLLVSQDEYHSPYMQAARILVDKFTGTTSKLPIRFTFGVGREHVASFVAGSQYQFKYIHSIETPRRLTNTVRKVDNSVGTL